MPTPTQLIARNRNLPQAFVPAENKTFASTDSTIDYEQNVPEIALSKSFPANFDSQIPDIGGGLGTDEKFANPAEEVSPPASVSSYDPNAPSIEDEKSPVANSLTAPYLAQLEANRKKRAALKTMPITKSDGSTVGGWEAFGDDAEQAKAEKQYTDTNGRVKSGFKALLQSLANNPQLRNARSWGDLAKSLTYSAAAGVGGAINSSWDEQQKRERALAQIDADDERIKKEAGEALKMANSESLIDSRQRTQNRQDAAFEERVKQTKLKNIKDEKKDILAKYAKLDHFYMDEATPEQKAELEAANITLGDFDKRYKPYNDKGGVRKVWDLDKREYVAAAGDEPDEPLIPVEIDGIRLNLKPHEFANYKAQESTTNYRTQLAAADNEQDYNDKLTKWQSDEEKRSADNIKLVNDGNTKHTEYIEQDNLAKSYETRAAELAADNPAEAEKYREKAIQARAKASSLKTQSESLINRSKNSRPLPKPVKQEKLPEFISPIKATPPPGASKGGKNDNIGTPKNYAEALRKIRGY